MRMKNEKYTHSVVLYESTRMKHEEYEGVEMCT